MVLAVPRNGPRLVALSPVGVQTLGRNHFLEKPYVGVGPGMREVCWAFLPSSPSQQGPGLAQSEHWAQFLGPSTLAGRVWGLLLSARDSKEAHDGGQVDATGPADQRFSCGLLLVFLKGRLCV